MLIGIPPVVGPDLLNILYRMGHGDELVLADAFFTGETLGKRVIRCDGVGIPALLDGILRLVTLDDFVSDSLVIMEPVTGDHLDPAMETRYRAAIEKYYPRAPAFHRLERFAFYERAKRAFAVVMTSETVKYGNIILKKGLIPV